jgi:cytochrome c oxidase assembly protein subunit 11
MAVRGQRKPARGRKARVAERNRRLTGKLAVAALLMFGFGFALVPLYDVFCDITGLNGKTGRAEAEMLGAKVDTSRWVTVEFTGSTGQGLPWEFRPMQKKLRVHPGQTTVANYYVRNTAAEPIVGRAIPSVTPGVAAAHFKKIECFCFSEQTLQPGEAREMPVRFVVDPELAAGIATVTLSYTFFNTDPAQAKRYGGDGQAPAMDHDQHRVHAGPATTGG